MTCLEGLFILVKEGKNITKTPGGGVSTAKGLEEL
jgi:hypothetical protein